MNLSNATYMLPDFRFSGGWSMADRLLLPVAVAVGGGTGEGLLHRSLPIIARGSSKVGIIITQSHRAKNEIASAGHPECSMRQTKGAKLANVGKQAQALELKRHRKSSGVLELSSNTSSR